ncbi:arylesterase [Candidatus Pseudothioglobus singularis]|jgi:acyl-CoA thioesterase I|nr:arylesterase [Candidatus Pseudothioglobus singularis]MDB4847721.1 arylesterase [Candidatus Pseudothioglobus singularis]
MIISNKNNLRSLFIGLLLIFFISNVYAENSLKVMLYGDSLMAGYGLPQNENLTSELTRNYKESNPSLTFINASISGNTSKNGLSRVDWSLGDNPNIVILCLGANDMLRGLDPALTNNNLDVIITKFKKNNAIVILAGMLSPESMGPDYQSAFDSIYPELSKKHSLIFMPFLLKGVALEKGLLLADYKHPNAKGVEVIATNLNPYIVEAISRLK